MSLALKGIRILDLGTLTPGKFCTFLLADLGAEVLRIERPGADPTTVSVEDLHLNRGKRSMTLNLREDAGREVFYRLLDAADVLIESNRPGVAERIGIGYERMKQRNDRLVYCSISGFGQDGPNRLRPAYDLNIMGMSGVLQALAGGQLRSHPPETYLADAVSGLTAALAVSVALFARERDGRGRYLDLAMFDCLFSILSVSHGLRRTPDSPGPPAGQAPDAAQSALYALYETSDGRQITLAAIRSASCQALFTELGRPELANRVFADAEGNARVGEFLRETFKTASANEWIARLGRFDIEIGPVRTPAEAFDDPQLLFRRMVALSSHPQAGPFEEIGNPLRAGGPAPGSQPPPAPAIGADTDAVLAGLGYDRARIVRLRETGIV